MQTFENMNMAVLAPWGMCGPHKVNDGFVRLLQAMMFVILILIRLLLYMMMEIMNLLMSIYFMKLYSIIWKVHIAVERIKMCVTRYTKQCLAHVMNGVYQ